MMQWLIFIPALILTLFYGSYLWLSIPGWIALIFLLRERKFALIAIFFFASFFHPTGFLPDLFFTIKHFHLALFLVIAHHLIKKKAFSTFSQGFFQTRPLWPIGILLFIATLAALIQGESWKTFSMTANLTVVFLSLIYLTGMLNGERELLSKCLLGFVSGVTVQVLVNVYNNQASGNIFLTDLMYNNQFGALTAFATYYGVSLMFVLKNRFLRISSFFLTSLTFTGLVLSCSRSAWLGFLGAFLFWSFFLVQKCLPLKQAQKVLRARILFPILGFIGICLALFVMNYDVSQRISHLYQIIDIDYWRYTLQDHQNYGFLGINRVEQIKSLVGILQEHYLMGIGFAHRVTDFHGNYFIVLGASGVLGLVLFGVFVSKLIKDLLKTIRRETQLRSVLMQVSILSAFIAWLISGVLQSMLVQYSVWISVLGALVLLKASEKEPLNTP